MRAIFSRGRDDGFLIGEEIAKRDAEPSEDCEIGIDMEGHNDANWKIIMSLIRLNTNLAWLTRKMGWMGGWEGGVLHRGFYAIMSFVGTKSSGKYQAGGS